MLLLCVTGLPLIFHDEIDDVLHDQVKTTDVPEGTPPANHDRLESPTAVLAFLASGQLRRLLPS